MVVHIPHSSKRLPTKDIILSKEELDKELERMTDHKTDVLFAHENALIFPYSRLYCDVERLMDDEMEKIGMGICYTRASNGRLLYKDNANNEMERRSFYEGHHAFFEKAVKVELDEKGKCLIIDAHSFPEEPLPYMKDLNMPDICMGTNEWDDGVKEIADFTECYFSEKGYRVLRNSPFWGSMVPEKYKYDKRVSSMMIEVNRKLYTDFEKIRDDIQELLQILDREH